MLSIAHALAMLSTLSHASAKRRRRELSGSAPTDAIPWAPTEDGSQDFSARLSARQPVLDAGVAGERKTSLQLAHELAA